jgi:hypothetical protein
MQRRLNVLTALVMGFGTLPAYAGTSSAQENPVTAIDIALEPDATMIQHAEAANARLLEVFPKGFRLDATHHPHISMLQRYVRTADLDPEINQPTIDYVAAFVPNETGKKFNPHVTIGIAPQDYLKAMIAEPFDVFTFSPVSASVYQLGNFGTARKKLKAWDLKP